MATKQDSIVFTARDVAEILKAAGANLSKPKS
jgi:hypothetical protein